MSKTIKVGKRVYFVDKLTESDKIKLGLKQKAPKKERKKKVSK